MVATSNEVRSAYINSLRMSTPLASVPSQWVADGHWLTFAMSGSPCAYGASNGAQTAITTAARMIQAPDTASLLRTNRPKARRFRLRTRTTRSPAPARSGASPAIGAVVLVAMACLHSRLHASAIDAHAWVDHPVGDVDREVHQDRESREEDDGRLRDGIVAAGQRSDRVESDAGDTVHRLDHEVADHQEGDARTDEGDDRDQGVAQDVADEHPAFAEPL